MFAKSTQVGLVSLFVVLATALGGCAESVRSTPANFPAEQRPVAFLARTAPVPLVRDEESLQGSRVSSLPPRADAKHFARPLSAR